jgi:hypothetical protein
MAQLRKYIENWINGEKVKGVFVTLNDVYELIDIYNRMVKKEKPTTISSNVKNVLDKCKIETKVDGIGWVIA